MSSKNNGRFITIVIIAVLCGLVAGVLGEVITRVYILKDFSLPYFNNEVNLADLNSNRSNLIIRDAKKVVVNQDIKVTETINSVQPTLMGVFRKINPTVDGYYKLDEPLFITLTITSDGWLAASLPDELKGTFSAKNYITISQDRKIYEIDKIADFNNLSGDLIFFHLANVNNLPVKKIVPRTDLSLGQSVVIINDFNNVLLTSLSSFQKIPSVLSSDSLEARLILANNLSNSFENSFVFNLAGDLVAVIGSDKEVISAFSYRSYWQSLIEKEELIKPFLGINYLDLSLIKPVDINLDKGALIYSSTERLGVIKNSPAAQAGLKDGDIITWVNNQEINSTSDLADLIANYSPGELITLTYLRDNVENELDIKLGELK